MREFAALYSALDSTTSTNEKITAMAGYFATAPPADAAWAVYFLSGRRPKRLIPAQLLRLWAAELVGIPLWLLEESYGAVGDSAEAAVLLLPPTSGGSEQSLRYWVEERILPLRGLDEDAQRDAILQAWAELDDGERFVFSKLITGAFRVGVSQRLLTRALAAASGVDAAVIAHRLMGHWQPEPDFFQTLVAPETAEADISRPYPFFLAYPLEAGPESLGELEVWQVEWKWDGIRAQLIRRAGETFLWSRGEELVTQRYPEIGEAAAALPDGTVLDGEILAWADGQVLPFAQLQRRIGRQTLGKKLLSEVPAVLLLYDLLEWRGEDIRQWPLWQRREQLQALTSQLNDPRLPLSATVAAGSWQELAERRAESRDRLVEGLMLKRRSSPYQVGRRRGDWWKWKIEPYTIDCVLIYAQKGSGRRANLYTDYTFAVWDGDELVPFAKAYSGLTDAEIREVDRFVRDNTRERFGPVRSVRPELVFELAFENIQRSNRHKSGVAVRFPRIVRWRRDKTIADADHLASIKAMLPTAADDD